MNSLSLWTLHILINCDSLLILLVLSNLEYASLVMWLSLYLCIWKASSSDPSLHHSFWWWLFMPVLIQNAETLPHSNHTSTLDIFNHYAIIILLSYNIYVFFDKIAQSKFFFVKHCACLHVSIL
jgi:hypothetical protein